MRSNAMGPWSPEQGAPAPSQIVRPAANRLRCVASNPAACTATAATSTGAAPRHERRCPSQAGLATGTTARLPASLATTTARVTTTGFAIATPSPVVVRIGGGSRGAATLIQSAAKVRGGL